MARVRRRKLYKIYLILVSFLFKFCLCETVVPNKDELKVWAENLDVRLTTALEKITGISVLEKSYMDLKKASLKPFEGQKLVKEMSSKLTSYLEKKMVALQRLVDAAEDAVMNYKYDASISSSDVVRVNMKNFSFDDPDLTYNEKYKRAVNLSYSGVHIPLEIYEGYPEILNGLKWSSALDTAFQENVRKDPTLMWQSFASTTGFLRIFPAHKWISGVPDLFDVRQRPWYIHASTSPKDMLILMDTSGSMHGQTMEIMKVSVKMMLTTLGEDDFVNVAWFSNISKFISCFETFVQASRVNKRILYQDIAKLNDSNMASLSTGLQFAFEEFENFVNNKTSWAGANCHKIISIFTDGGTEDVTALLKKLNRDKKVRIFTFTVGPHPIPYATLKKIACGNKGYFSSVLSMSAIRTKVQMLTDYVKVLSRPMVLAGEKEYDWNNFHVDSASLELLTTVTLPVFNKSEIGNQSMAGVMAVDVALQELIAKEPRKELGPQGYSFVINRNGFVVFHPDLPIPTNFLDDPPRIDILDLEVEDVDTKHVRNAMINREKGERTVTGLIEMPDMKHLAQHTLKYYYTPINNTTFSLGIVLDPLRTHYLEIKNMYPNKVYEQEEGNGILLAPWKYCRDMVLQGNSSEILRNITLAAQYPDNCDKSLMQHLLWDLEKTRSVLKYWQTEEIDGQRDVVLSTFASTESGLTRVFPESTSSRFLEVTDPRKALFYRRALYSKDFIFLLPEVALFDGGNESQAVVTCVKALTLSDRGKHYKPAVVGSVLDLSYVQALLLETPPNPKRLRHTCGHTDSLLCYLVDDGGFIITTNQADHLTTAGKFLGAVDLELMTKLLEKKIYSKIEKYNNEGLCAKPKKKDSAASHIDFNPFSDLFGKMHLVFGWLYELLFCLSFWWSPVELLPEMIVETDGMGPCTLLTARYHWDSEPQNRHLDGSINCNDKNRDFSSAPVGQTNLLLVVTNHPIGCSNVQPLIQTPEEVDPPDLCHPKVRYRRRPEKCFSYHPQENTAECGASASLLFPCISLGMEALFLMLHWMHS